MRVRVGSFRPAVSLLMIAAVALSCNLGLAPPRGATTPPATAFYSSGNASASAASSGLPSAAPATVTSIPPSSTPVPKVTETETPTSLEPIVVTVSGGKLNVRRGPGPEYDTVGALLDGQSATVTGRNEDGTWVLVNVPRGSKSLGWITVQTRYTALSGAVMSVPVTGAAPAIPAYIRNCTAHEMLVTPGGLILSERSSSPENQMQFFPGEYSVFDETTSTSVADVTVFEGRTVDIKRDGAGKSYSCP